jgi:hypothetical protein
MPQSKAKRSGKRARAFGESSEAAEVPGNGKRGPGRPPIHVEEWTKATVVLFTRQIDFLDNLAASIRAHNGKPVSRAQLIRALIDAVAASGIDLTPAASEAEMKEILLRRLGFGEEGTQEPPDPSS